MAAPLISLSDAKSWLGITDTTSDSLVSSLIAAATDAAIRFMSRDPRRQQYTRTVSGLGGPTLPLPDFPIVAVTTVSLLTASTADLAPPNINVQDLVWDDNAIHWRGNRFARGFRNVSVTYTAGLEPLPDAIKQAMRYIVRAMFDAQSVDMNATGESFVGLGSSQWWASGPGAMPPQAQALLMPYINPYRAA